VLDGNVFRVLSRIMDIELPIDTTEGKKYFAALAQYVLPKDKAGVHNQAIMDFGATICKPQPECAHCFFNKHCLAFLQNKQAALPVKSKQVKTKVRWFHYLILEYENAIALQQRTAKDIWQNLYEVLLIEGDSQWNKEKLLQQLVKSYNIHPDDYEVISAAASTTQKLSHQLIHFSFIHLQLKKQLKPENFIWVSKENLFQYPFPKTLQAFLAKNL
jgi:A/G-specific adenine glycosylase